MKKFLHFVTGLSILLILGVFGCKSDPPAPPCNNTGTVCVENKLDSNLVVSITQTHAQETLPKDFMQCFELEANQAYTFTFSGKGYTRPDTTVMVLPCDNELIIIKN